MISFAVFTAMYIVGLVLAMVAGLMILVGYSNLYLRKTLVSLKWNVVYILMLIILPTTIILVNTFLPSTFKSAAQENLYTGWLYQLGGGAIKVLQTRLNYGLLTDIFVFAYVWVFTFIVAFSPLLLLAKDDHATLRRYSIALALNYIILLPFVLFFPVTVPSGYPQSGVAPLLYIKSNWGRMVTGIDPLTSGFPSGHTSISVATLLVFALAGNQYRKYAYFLVGAAASIIFSVLYLGVHWPMDVFVGFFIGVGVVLISRLDRIEMSIERWVGALTTKIFGETEASSAMRDDRS